MIEYDYIALCFLDDNFTSGGFRTFEEKVSPKKFFDVCGFTEDQLRVMMNDFVSQNNYRLYPCTIQYTVDRSGKRVLSHISLVHNGNGDKSMKGT